MGFYFLKKHHLSKKQIGRVEEVISILDKISWIFPPFKILDTALKGSNELSLVGDAVERLEDVLGVYKNLTSHKFPRSIEDLKKYGSELKTLAIDLSEIADDIKKIEKYL